MAQRPRHIAVEGPIGAGKSAVAERLAAALGLETVLDNPRDNPFLEAFLGDKARYAFQAQVFFLLNRHQLLARLTQGDLFSAGTVTDFLFERERIFAALHLSPEELALYDRIHAVVRERVPRPDLVVYLQAPAEVLHQRLRHRGPDPHRPALRDLEEMNRVYNDFFFHYADTPLLVVNTADVDLSRDDTELRALATEILKLRGGTRHYIPRPSAG
ncbi:MAG: deoxynucleoside kinase [Deltaproteobacteria bacterium]|nr:deoxynucleoside kinase [Deltaproteobacteria bacterium]